MLQYDYYGEEDPEGEYRQNLVPNIQFSFLKV
jgi:hypothetical protein